MNFATFKNLVQEHLAGDGSRIVVPVSKRCSADLLTPVSAYLTLRRHGIRGFLFESVEGGEKLARYSFLGVDPFLTVTGDGTFVSIGASRNSLPFDDDIFDGGDIFGVMRRIMESYAEVKLPDTPRLSCGAVGYMGYDTARLIEKLPPPARDDLDIPDASWSFYDTIAAFDHVKHQLVLMASVFVSTDTDLEDAFTEAQQRIAVLETKLREPAFEPPQPVSLNEAELQSNIERSEFEGAVEKGKRYIYEGDIFQVVLSQRFRTRFEGDHFNLYRALRQVNPSPYLFYIDDVDYSIVGSSPEVLVRLEGGTAEVLPIAGTRPRGNTLQEDARLEEELLDDPKERAEHLMLVDLGRNDLGRVCEFNSVEVDRYAYIERFSHVMHIVSSVTGQVKPGLSALDVLAACFPAGTVSGAPKVRAMEIIGELEPTKRGIYSGAVGYIDFSGNLDTCIAIRTMVVKNNMVYIQAGAGIVADSIPEKEYEETENKARALKQALLMAGADLL